MGLIDRVREFTGFGKAEVREVPVDAAREVPASVEVGRVQPGPVQEGGRDAVASVNLGRVAPALPRVPVRAIEPRVHGIEPGNPGDGAESLARVPRTRDFEEVMSVMQRMYAEAPDRDVMAVLGRADGRETDKAPPPPGAKRQQWIAERVAIAFDAGRDYATHPAHSQSGNPQTYGAVEYEVGTTLRERAASHVNLHVLASGRRARLSDDITDFMQDGARLEQRIDLERQHLDFSSDGQIEQRFSRGPMSSMRALPARGPERDEWINDRLRAEHAAARAGLMTGSEVVHAASADRGQRPYAPDAQMPIIDWTQASVARKMADRDAVDLGGLPDASLRSRYRGVPGMDEVAIPRGGSPDRASFIRLASEAQRVRETMPNALVVERDLDMSPDRGKGGLTATVNSAPVRSSPPPGLLVAINAGMTR